MPKAHGFLGGAVIGGLALCGLDTLFVNTASSAAITAHLVTLWGGAGIAATGALLAWKQSDKAKEESSKLAAFAAQMAAPKTVALLTYSPAVPFTACVGSSPCVKIEAGASSQG